MFPSLYILLYFLNEPRDDAVDTIRSIAARYAGKKIIAIPYAFEQLKKIEGVAFVDAGPAEFVDLVANAAYVCTDSFHGLAFSVKMNVPFVIFERNYGAATTQSSRIRSILSILGAEDRYVQDATSFNNSLYECDYAPINRALEHEREKSVEYLRGALQSCEKE